MTIKCIIIEDEPLAIEKLVDFIKKLDFLQLINTFDNGIIAINFLKKHPVDLIFLDIQMKDLSGIQFLKSLQKSPKIIITSAYSQYALEGYEYNVTDYLLKPFDFDRFLKAVNKVSDDLNKELEKSQDNNFIFIKTEYRIERVDLREILYIEGMKEKKILTLLSFKKILELLPKSNFTRIHKSFIVALDKIENIERNRIKINNRLIPITETYRDDFFALLRNEKYIIS